MFKYIVLLAALFLATISAWFSVSGISQLFIGSFTAAMIMAIALEFGKVVGISFLYRYWEILSKPLRVYMTLGGIVLMLITSVGVYGYLSSAYSRAAVDYIKLSNSTQQIQSDIDITKSQIQQYTMRIEQLSNNRQQQENRLNQLVGKTGFITQQRIVAAAEKSLNDAQSEISSLYKKQSELTSKKVESENAMNSNGKIGTFNYFAKALNVPLDTIVKWFILIIVCVFDPMSLALMLSYNTLVKHQINQSKDGLWVEPPISKFKSPNKEPDHKNDVPAQVFETPESKISQSWSPPSHTSDSSPLESATGTPWIAPEPKGEKVI